jgi:outer membrane protein assembly factor BamE
MVDKLETGMSKSQVQFVMGTPLIVDSFNQTRWDYIYKYLSPTGVETEEQVTIFFDNKGLLKGVVGDYAPANLNR